MIQEKTVFILGAGASCHLGYPLGKDLWREIVAYLSPIKDFGKISKEESAKEKERKENRNLLIKIGFSEKDITEFCNNLSGYAPITLDEFLESKENNIKYRDLAKLAIAQVLKPYEDENILIKQQEWYQKLFAKMKPIVDNFHKNNVVFISFNYDRSLEQYLFHKLQLSRVGKTRECEEEIKELKFIHVFGKLGDLPWQSNGGCPYKKKYNNKDELLSASKGIMTAHEQPQNLKIFESVFRNAKRILFLGFRFDKFNLEKLNLLPCEDETKLITGTVFDLGPAKIREIEAYFMEKNYKIVLRDMKVLDFFDDVNLS